MSKQKMNNKQAELINQFGNCVWVEWLGFIRKKSFLASLVIYLMVSLYFFIAFKGNTGIQHIVYNTEYLQVITIALAGAFGLSMGGMERHCDFFDVMISFKRAKYVKLAAKIVNASFFAGICYLITVFVTLLAAALQASALSVIVNCVVFLFLRIFFPAFIFSIIGIAIGCQVKSQFKYAFWLLVTFIFGPIFPRIHSYIFIAFNSNSRLLEYVLNMFNMGSFGTNISEVYGHPIEFPFWIYMIIVTILGVAYCCAVYSGNRFSPRRYFVVTALFIAVYLGGLCLSYNPFTYTFFVNYGYCYGKSNTMYDAESFDMYYSGYQTLIENKIPYRDMDKGIHLSPCSWEIKLNPGMVMLHAEAELEAIAKESFDRQTFTLYQNYCVKKVSVNGEKCEFVRNNNYLCVKMPKTVSKGDRVKIRFTYSGLSSPTEPGNKYIISLTSDFPWLPRIGTTELPGNTLNEDVLLKLYASSQKFEEKVRYTLYFDSNYIVYTNLKETEKGVYKGDSDTGLTVVAYAIQSKKQIGNITVYYPASIESQLDMETESYRLSFDAVKDFLAFFEIEALDAGMNMATDTIVILPTSFGGEYRNSSCFCLDNVYVIYYWNAGLIGYRQYLCDSMGINDYSLSVADELIQSGLSSYHSFTSDSTDYFIENYMLYWYYSHYSGSIGSSSFISESADSRREQIEFMLENIFTENTVASRLIDMEKNGKDEEIRFFLREWYIDRTLGICHTDRELMEKLNTEQ